MISQNPQVMRSSDDHMLADSQMKKLALKDYRHIFESLGSIVDVAGGGSRGTGTMARITCEAFPKVHSI